MQALNYSILFYTVVMLLIFILIIINIPILHHSFFPGLKASFSANPSHRIAFLFFFRTDYTNSPDCLPIRLSMSVFLLFSFLVFHFLVAGFRALD